MKIFVKHNTSQHIVGAIQEFAQLFSDSRYGKAIVPRLWNLERCGMYVPIPKEFTSIMRT